MTNTCPKSLRKGVDGEGAKGRDADTLRFEDQPAFDGSSMGHAALVIDVAVECLVGRPAMSMSMLIRNRSPGHG
jgi:hypothetical protein